MRAAAAACWLAAAVLWSLPLLAAGLVALLRFGFGSLFVVGESLASALLRSSGADIAGTVGRLQAAPGAAALVAAAGLAPCVLAAASVGGSPVWACAAAGVSAAWGLWSGLPWATAPLALGIVLAAPSIWQPRNG